MSEIIEPTPVQRYFIIRSCRNWDLTFREISDLLGISRQRACQIYHSELPKKHNKFYKTKPVELNSWHRDLRRKIQDPNNTGIISS